MNPIIPENIEIEIKTTVPDYIKNGIDKSEITSKHGKWFQAACYEALKSDFDAAKIGCVVVYKNSIISYGHNQLKTDPIQKEYNLKYREWKECSESCECSSHSLHAEIDALKNITYPIAKKLDWKKVDVYVYRIGIGLSNYTGLALPCPACANALADYGVRNVYYTTGRDDNPFGHCDL